MYGAGRRWPRPGRRFLRSRRRGRGYRRPRIRQRWERHRGRGYRRHGSSKDPAGKRVTTPSGLVIVDKPQGWTSHDVVAKIRKFAGTRRVGHAGTLDPMATGVLVVGVEKATRLLGYLAVTEKEYSATIRLGQTTDTDDADGVLINHVSSKNLTLNELRPAVAALTGQISQVPPGVSAIKVGGTRSYKLARAGETPELAARTVTVSAFEIDELRHDDDNDVTDVDVRVTCSSGTYIRALARDLGAALGVGGHLTALRRTRVGPYQVGQAATLEQLQQELTVMPIAEAAAAAFPRWDVDAKRARLLLNGVRLEMPEAYAGVGSVAVFDPEGRFLALVEEHKGKAKSLA